MACFLLVHGAWQGAWCWQNVAERLEKLGHTVLTPNLPGYGSDSAHASSTTLQDYISCIKEAVISCAENPVLVGHSSGGFISLVADIVPDRIRSLVFIAALVPADGYSMMQFVNQFDLEYLSEIQWAPDGRSARLSVLGAANFLYSECPPAVVNPLLPMLGVQSVAPYEYRFSPSSTNFGKVPRHYIRTVRDRLVPPRLQEEICAIHDFKSVHSLDADHSPFFSTPERLSSLLHMIAQQS